MRLPATIADGGEFIADARALDAAGADVIWIEDGAADAWIILGALSSVTHRARLGFAHADAAGETSLNFKPLSPMSVGTWALLIFGFFSLVSAVEARASDSSGRNVIPLVLNRVFNIVGSVFGLYIVSYTGILFSVSNQPVWSDTWVIGALFLASGLSASAATVAYLMRWRPEAAYSLDRLHVADGYFSILELILLAVFGVTVVAAGTGGRLVPFLPLWALAVAGMAASLVGARGHARLVSSGGAATVARARIDTVVIVLLVLIGMLALRGAVIFSAQ